MSKRGQGKSSGKNTARERVPSRLFKYRCINEFTEAFFTKQELKFSKPRDFNDPFDCVFRIVIRGKRDQEVIEALVGAKVEEHRPEWSLERKFAVACHGGAMIVANHREEAEGKLGESLARETNDKVGIFCFAGTDTDILMWSHYADKHTGICLEFRMDLLNAAFGKAQRVKYGNRYPDLGLRDYVENEQLRVDAGWMLTKSKQWRYEMEWRILDFKNGPGVRKFPPACLTAVILGCRITPENREKVLGWVRRYPADLQVREAKESPKRFRMEIEDLQSPQRRQQEDANAEGVSDGIEIG